MPQLALPPGMIRAQEPLKLAGTDPVEQETTTTLLPPGMRRTAGPREPVSASNLPPGMLAVGRR
jgi:hypothetical protein